MKILNCTQHNLTLEQKKELSGYDNLRDVARHIFDLIKTTPSDEKKIQENADKFLRFLAVNHHKYDYFLMPIGSPFFMATVISRAISTTKEKIIFSHSERIIDRNNNREHIHLKFLFLNNTMN